MEVDPLEVQGLKPFFTQTTFHRSSKPTKGEILAQLPSRYESCVVAYVVHKCSWARFRSWCVMKTTFYVQEDRKPPIPPFPEFVVKYT